MAKLFAIGRRYFLWSMALTLVAISGPVFAGPEDEVSAAMERWAATYATATNANAMVAFYAKDAVFWGTGSRQPFVGSDSFAPYFARQSTIIRSAAKSSSTIRSSALMGEATAQPAAALMSSTSGPRAVEPSAKYYGSALPM